MARILKDVRDLLFKSETVVLDGNAFLRCTFQQCELRYDGGPVTFQETEVVNCSWMFGGPAQRTINLYDYFGLNIPGLEVSQHRLAC